MRGSHSLIRYVILILLVAVLTTNATSLWRRKPGILSWSSRREEGARLGLVAKAIPSKTDADSAGSANVDGLQVVITKKMRRVLVDELMYTEDEVDNLDPQIAAVLIERKLSRPKKGVPVSWLKSSSKERQWQRQVDDFLDHLSEKAAQFGVLSRLYLVPLLPYAAAGSLLFFQRHLLLRVATRGIRGLQQLPDRLADSWQSLVEFDEEGDAGADETPIDHAEVDEGVDPPRGSLRFPTATSASTTAVRPRRQPPSSPTTATNGRVNLRSLDRVQRRSWWDRWTTPSSEWHRHNPGALY